MTICASLDRIRVYRNSGIRGLLWRNRVSSRHIAIDSWAQRNDIDVVNFTFKFARDSFVDTLCRVTFLGSGCSTIEVFCSYFDFYQ
jgi:hypothetical protein